MKPWPTSWPRYQLMLCIPPTVEFAKHLNATLTKWKQRTRLRVWKEPIIHVCFVWKMKKIKNFPLVNEMLRYETETRLRRFAFSPRRNQDTSPRSRGSRNVLRLPQDVKTKTTSLTFSVSVQNCATSSMCITVITTVTKEPEHGRDCQGMIDFSSAVRVNVIISPRRTDTKL